MYQPLLKANKKSFAQIKSFLGLNQSQYLAENEIRLMKNLSSRSFPLATNRKPRKAIATSINNITRVIKYDGDKLTAIAGGKLYYENQLVPNFENGTSTQNYTLIATDVIDYMGKIYIFPDKLYYDYKNGATALISMTDKVQATGITFRSIITTTSTINTIEGASWEGYFKKGDSLVISGCSIAKNNTIVPENMKNSSSLTDIVSVVVEEIFSNSMTVSCYNSIGQQIAFKVNTNYSYYVDYASVTIQRRIPDFACVCIHNNRLFGASIDGGYIYASKLGDFTNFNAFAGLSTDSWWANVATDEPFVAIASFENHVVAFKRNYIYEVYGDKPSNFQVPYVTNGGTISEKSVCMVNGALYFIGDRGVMGFRGGVPISVSDKLSVNITDGVGGVLGDKYYLCITTNEGKRLLVYDTRLKLWHAEDDLAVTSFYSRDNKLYAVGDDLQLFDSDDSDEIVPWELTTKSFSYGIDKKVVNKVEMDISLGENSKASVYIIYDDEISVLCDTIYASDGRVVSVPVRVKRCDRFSINVQGEGGFTLHEMRVAVSG